MGSYVISNGQCCFIPSCRNINVVDPTGGGNSSTGGAFIGFCKNLSLERIGAMANVSAAICIEQFGVPPRIDLACRMLPTNPERTSLPQETLDFRWM